MTDGRRLFSSLFYGGKISNSRADQPSAISYQDQRAGDAPPIDSLKDLQQLLGRLLAERGGPEGVPTGDAVWHSDGGFRQQLNQQPQNSISQHHSRSWSQQEKPKSRRRGYYYPGELDEKLWASADAPIQLRHRDRPEHAASRVKSSGGAEILARQYRMGDLELLGEGRQMQGRNYNHWFSEKIKSGEVEGSDNHHRRHVSDVSGSSGGGVSFDETPIPVIDRRRGGHQRASTRVSRVPASPSWPLTCVVQQREFTHREGPTTIYQEVESSDLRPIGQGICSLEDSPGQEPGAVTSSGRPHRANGWWQSMPSSADGSLQRRHQAKGAVPVSAKREATLRASAEQLDSLAPAITTPQQAPPLWHHRQAVSSGADYAGLNLARCVDYEATTATGNSANRLLGDVTDASRAPSASESTIALWYRPEISREQAIAVLKEAPAGSFLIRDSLTYRGAFGLAVRVARQQPTGAPQPLAVAGTRGDELVRHFLIEPQQPSGGVRLRGCINEPVFASLAELVQCHCQVALALPCRLRLPIVEPTAAPPAAVARTLQRRSDSVDETARRGSTYRVLYFCTVDVPNGRPAAASSGWGADAVSAAVSQVAAAAEAPRPVECRMRVSDKGVKLSGLGWHRDFRLAYAAQDCSVCRLDSNGRRYADSKSRTESRLFGLVVRKYGLYGNQSACLVLGDLEPTQPAASIAAFVNRCVRSTWERLR